MSDESERGRKPSKSAPGSVRYDSTLHVLERARVGDAPAVEELLARTISPLRRWARGRLPAHARAGANTEDVLQDVVVRVLGKIKHFEHQTVDALQHYLRTSVRNRILDEIRRTKRRGAPAELSESLSDGRLSSLEQVILKERSERYLAALRALRPEERLAVIYRLEHRLSFEAIGAKLNKPSADAARMAVHRAIKKLAAALRVSHDGGFTRPGAAGRGGAGRRRMGTG